MTQAALQAPPRWGPLTPQTWPQDDNRIPNTGGFKGPPISQANRDRARQESFSVPVTFTLPTTITVGQVLQQYVAMDIDGDFWVDQIYAVGWGLQIGPRIVQSAYPLLGTLDIQDARTGKSLVWPPNSLPTTFLSTLILFSDDTGFDPSGSPFPDGFRSTGTLAQPFCFVRGGGITVSLTSAASWNSVAGPNLTDICFSGWKEYEYASH